MNAIVNSFNQLPFNASGLNGIVNELKDNWLAPVFILIVAGVSIMFLVQRELRKLAVFLVIAMLVGVLLFFGEAIFGKNGNLTNWGKKQATSINTVMVHEYEPPKIPFIEYE